MAKKQDLIDTATRLGITVPARATIAVIEKLIAEHVPPPGPVRQLARWVHVQAVMVPGVGLIRYGDTFEALTAQIEASPKMVAASDTFVPDPALAAVKPEEA